jgi:NADH-quinone oxidoreductase subunit L
VQAGGPWVAAVFIVGTAMTIAYLMRAFNAVFLGPARSTAKEGSASMVASVVSLAALSLAGGLLIFYPSAFASQIVNQIDGLAPSLSEIINSLTDAMMYMIGGYGL